MVGEVNIRTNPVVIPRSGKPALSGYQAMPDESGHFPGVLVIHELYGLNDNIREVTERFARNGFAALAVNLFSGANRVTCLLRIFYGMIIKPLHNGTVDELRNAIDFLRQSPRVDANRLGVIGFCMGGTYALQLACVEEDLRVAAIYYGQNPRPLDAVAGACPIVGSYPQEDFTARAARKLEEALKKHGVPHDIKIYEGARHSFFNDHGRAYDPEAAADSWARTLFGFDQQLKQTG